MEKLLEKLASLSIENLLGVIEEAEKQLRAKRKAEQDKAKQEIAELARKAGIAVHFANQGVAAPVQGRAPAKPKYQNPATGETWAGRGQQPKWVRDAVAGGATLDSLLIK